MDWLVPWRHKKLSAPEPVMGKVRLLAKLLAYSGIAGKDVVVRPGFTLIFRSWAIV